MQEGISLHGLARGPSRRWVALGVVCLGQLMLTLDTTIVNIALPSIQRELGFSAAALTWVPNAYLIALGSFLLLGGRLGDLWGRTPMFLTGIAVFTAASLACGLAGSPGVLVFARFVQGVGAAVMASGILALIVVEFPDPAGRATATSVYTFVAIAGGSLGLIIGGWVTQALGWHWIFFINVPVGIAAFAAGRVTLERPPACEARRGVDWVGSALITLSCLAGITAIVRSENVGIGSAGTVGLLLLALALLVAFFVVERRIPDPILPPRILRTGSLTVVAGSRWLLLLGNFGAFFVGVLYFQHVKGFSPRETGAAFLPQTLLVAAMSVGPAIRLARRFGLLATFLTGDAAVIVGIGWLAVVLRPHTPYFPWVALPLALMGFGMGTAFISSTQLGLADVARGDAGIASGVLNMSQQIGAATGVALLGTIAATRATALEHRGVAMADALCSGYRLSLAVGAALVFVSLVAAGLLLHDARPGAPSRV